MDRVLHRNAAFALAGLFLFAIWGFWPNYFSHPLTQANWRFHFHGITLISWFGLMISQAYLIRTNRRRVHRQVGKVSFFLAPLVVISTLVLAHYQLRPTELTDATLYFLLLPIALLLQFLLAYGLAIYHRRNPPLHARFMICTALPMMPAIFDRIMGFYVLPPTRAQFLPQIGGEPQYWLISWAMADVILILLAIWDWRSRRRLNVFPVVLAGFIILEALTMTAYSTASWRSFTQWFLSLPIS